MTDQIHSYKDLIVWQKSILLVTEIYRITALYPKQETYGLISQSRRCVVSIPSNIAEGRRRGSKKDFTHFLVIAFSSGAELETQLIIAKNLNYINSKDCEKADALLEEVMKMLNKMINNMKD
jgi:four helix bundle protein